MAEKAEKKAEAKPAAAVPAEGHGAEAAAKSGGGLLKSTPVLLGVVMLMEAVVLVAGLKMLGGSPKQSDAAIATGEAAEKEGHGDAKPDAHGEAKGDGHGDAHGDAHGGGTPAVIDKKALMEVQVLEFKAPNRQDGRTFLYDVSIFAVVKGEFKEKVEAKIKDRGATIKDRIRTIIAQSVPEKLGGGSEPGLETLRRQVKFQLDEVVGDGMIEEVIIPRCIPYRQDY